jgi:predicted RNA-binding protein with PIN domain
VQVRFSPTDRTADEVIVDLVHDLPANRPVVVVTSDREVAEGAEAGGAIVVSSAAFLTALGR